MPFIIAKTVTYVSSLTVTYVTTLYILASRQVSVSECSVEWENVGHRYEFAQRDCLLRAYTAREDDILPYSGWAVIYPAKITICRNAESNRYAHSFLQWL